MTAHRFARLERREPTRNVARFYLVEQRTTLWREPATVTTWGRIGAPGRQLVSIHPDEDSAERALRRAVRRRTKRGYTLAGGNIGPGNPGLP